ncbi:hypothetical protein U1Q18_033178 [Sarracenia purpurea var. burkii]
MGSVEGFAFCAWEAVVFWKRARRHRAYWAEQWAYPPQTQKAHPCNAILLDSHLRARVMLFGPAQTHLHPYTTSSVKPHLGPRMAQTVPKQIPWPLQHFGTVPFDRAKSEISRTV